MKVQLCLGIFLLITYFSGRMAHSQEINHWEMVVSADDTWSYFVGTSAPPTNWAASGFDDGTWLTGPGGIGYGEGNEGTVITESPANYAAVFIRGTFNIVDTSLISHCILHVDYDDGFVAYLNGNEIARANLGNRGTKPLYNQYADNDQHESQLSKGGIPARFILDKDTIAKYLVNGQNVLALEVHNCNSTSSDLASSTFFTLGITDASNNYRNVPAWFDDPLLETSHLPLMVIETWGVEIPDDPKIRAWLKVIDNGPGQSNNFLQPGTDYEGYMGIEVRGQSSQMFPKKSFGFETWNADSSGFTASLLGLPAEEDWVLYAPYSDKSLMRNALTYYLGSKMGTWQPRFKFVEVYLNGSYHGIYMLVEKIKRDKNRVDINKLNSDEISGDDLTGGYIVKVDKIWDLTPNEYFYTYPSNRYHNARNYAFTFDTPDYDDIVSQQKTYINNYLTTLENTLNGAGFKDPVNGFRKYMDENSFIDFQIIQELTNNVDGYRYSTFFHKKRDSDGGKLFAGPLWDFDLCYGNVDYAPDRLATNTWLYPNYGPDEGYCMHWWARLFEDGDYRLKFKDRWETIREGAFKTDSIMSFLDDTIAYLGEAIDRNFQRWQILGQYVWPNYYVGPTHASEVTYLKTWINNRLTWLDNSISKLTSLPVDERQKSKLALFPNPVRNEIKVRCFLPDKQIIDIEFTDALGKKVVHQSFKPAGTGEQLLLLTIPALPPTFYFLNVYQGNNWLGTIKFTVQNP